MRELRFFSVRSMLLLAAMLLTFGSNGSLLAQYPLLPVGSNGNANYEWRPDLGGWRDRQTNLIWGYQIGLIGGFTNTYAGAATIGPRSLYPQTILNAVPDRLARAQLQEERALLETDPVRKQARLDLAATFRADAAACSVAGAHAAAFSNWRVPTLAEFRSAYIKGMFSQGTAAFNFDAAPFTGYQRVNFVSFWTSDPAVRNGTRATVFYPGDGGSRLIGVDSNANVLVVRNGPSVQSQ